MGYASVPLTYPEHSLYFFDVIGLLSVLLVLMCLLHLHMMQFAGYRLVHGGWRCVMGMRRAA